MNNKRKLLIIIVIALIFSITVGTVTAYMFKRSSAVNNPFKPAEVKCSVDMSKNGTDIDSVTIKNIGSVDAYLRIRFVTYWVDEDNEIVSKPSADLSIVLNSNWIEGTDNTFYYKVPVASQISVELFADGFTFELATDGELKQVIQVFGEAVQADPSTSVESAWGVTVDQNNGNILTVK